jgi:cysteine desulfurase
MAKAFELAEAEREQEMPRQCKLRERLIDGVLGTIQDVTLTGARGERLANHASFIVQGADAESMLIALDMAGISASSGSACSSGAQRPSHVLEAMGVAPADAACALRFSFGRSNADADVDYIVGKLREITQRIRI